MNMGEFGGLYAVEKIMKESPLPILILSAVGNTDLQPIFDALQLGAVDYLNKPERGNSKIREIGSDLLKKIKSLTRANPKAIAHAQANTHKHTFDEIKKYDIIVIGASTGGPSAIEEIVVSLPSNLNVPVLIGQHMPTNFIGQFVKRLNKLSPLSVVEGSKSMTPKPGMVVIAPGFGNMILKKERKNIKIDFTEEVFKEYNNPSINSIMLSAAKMFGARTLAVILTGMGKDGVRGLKAIKDAGGYTIAQDEKSSVIYGMPKVAVETGAVTKSMHIKEIGSFLVNSL
jgi:two-component system chemotaxis response regulator CheB